MSREGVLCAGTILVDVAKVIDAYPALDHLATIEQVSLSTGGPGLNMAVDLRMLWAAFPIGVLGAVQRPDVGCVDAQPTSGRWTARSPRSPTG